MGRELHRSALMGAVRLRPHETYSTLHRRLIAGAYGDMTRYWVIALIGIAGCRAPQSADGQLAQARAEAVALAGRSAAEALEARYGGVCAEPAAEVRMRRVACRLAPDLERDGAQASYHVLDSEDLNALSLPGPRIYITRGLYSRLGDDRTLAAVIAHELAHVEAGDHFKARTVGSAEMLQRELAADARAVAMLKSAGLDGEAMRAALDLVEDVLPAEWAGQRSAALAIAD